MTLNFEFQFVCGFHFKKSYTCIKFVNILVIGSLIQSNAQITLIEILDHFQDKRYAQGRGFITKTINSCHTSSLSTPEDKEQAQQIKVSLFPGFSPKQLRQYTGITML